MIGIINDQQPLSIIFVTELAANELKYIHLWVFPPTKLDLFCNLLITLLEAGRIAVMHPKNPGLR